MGLVVAITTACGTQKPASTQPASQESFSSAVVSSEPAEASRTETAPETIDTKPAKDTDEEESYKNKASYKIMEEFAAGLAAGDYASLKETIYFPENSIVTEEDLAYLLPRSDFADLLETGNISIERFDTSAGSASAVLRSGQDEVSVSAALEDDNKWHVRVPGIYIENATILAPAKCQIKLNGIELDMNTARKHSQGAGRVVYTVTIPNRTIKGVSTTMFGDMEREMVKRDPEETEAMYTICPVPDEALTDEVMNAVKTNLNALYTLYEAGNMEVSSWQPYFSDKVTAEEIQNVQAAVKEMYTWVGDIQHLAVIQMLPRDNILWMASYDSIGVNAKMEHKMNDSSSSRTFGFFVMQKRADGTWVFGEQYPIEKNLTHGVTNSFTHDW